ncbi:MULTISPECIES: D-2-hydroxyacid dehydrogenase [Paenibacillus]|uniref:Hydroxyacid dehydrogenase n=1 Tax=Paenibacillus campinasensis TaxID=66347 RepID=A0A268EY32_9BACL|nr:D-2-hydroxyacid dehydrogenase [Paenibacillus campinasensis]PAD78028.1 hydroxyacid dehydrogenase [Paenibacillus campinasensis]
MPKILALHELTTEHKNMIQAAAPGFELITSKIGELAPGMVREAEILLGWSSKVEGEAVAPDSHTKWVQVWSAGVDKLPLDAFRQKGIWLTNASGVHSIPITEHIFAMILGFVRNLHHAVRQQTNRHWDTAGTFTELAGKTIVIVGVGQIGRQTAQVAKAFGMRTIGVRNSGEPSPHIDVMYKVDELTKALSEGDYIVNILPLTPLTTHIFDRDKFAAMKDSAFFVNVGRGQSVVTDAMVEALQAGKLAGAGLDVFEKEPLPQDHPLWSMDNVIITPHKAGDTDQYAERVIDIFLDNLKAYTQGRPLHRNVIDYDKSY